MRFAADEEGGNTMPVLSKAEVDNILKQGQKVKELFEDHLKNLPSANSNWFFANHRAAFCKFRA